MEDIVVFNKFCHPYAGRADATPTDCKPSLSTQYLKTGLVFSPKYKKIRGKRCINYESYSKTGNFMQCLEKCDKNGYIGFQYKETSYSSGWSRPMYIKTDC